MMQKGSKADRERRPLKVILLISISLIALSTFLAWGHPKLYLPWSIRITGGYRLPYSDWFPLISILIRLGALSGWAGYLTLEYTPHRGVSYIIITLSGIVTIISVIFFTITGTKPSIGAYMALIGGFLELIFILIANIEVEIILNENESVEDASY